MLNLLFNIIIYFAAAVCMLFRFALGLFVVSGMGIFLLFCLALDAVCFLLDAFLYIEQAGELLIEEVFSWFKPKKSFNINGPLFNQDVLNAMRSGEFTAEDAEIVKDEFFRRHNKIINFTFYRE